MVGPNFCIENVFFSMPNLFSLCHLHCCVAALAALALITGREFFAKKEDETESNE